MEILVKPLYSNSKPPIKKRRADAGWDLYAHQSYILKPGETIKLDCGVAIWIPDGFAGIIFPRSSWRQKGLLCQSVYDHGFTGIVEPFTTNASNQDIQVEAGERVLQLMFMHVQLGGRIRLVDDLPHSDRGEAGAGSTGKT